MIIGLTGSIASGKSTVAKMMRGYELPIVDADQVARDVVEPGSPTLAKIVAAFGEAALCEDGTMNREYVGQLIFHEPAKRNVLNDIIHPAIRTEMLRQRDEYVTNGHQHVVMDIPLLFESKLQHYVEKIIVVSVNEDVQLARLMARNGLSETDALARIRSQLPMSVKEAGANAVIYNNGSEEQAAAQLARILTEWHII